MAKKLEPAFTAARDGKAPEREPKQAPDVPTRIKKHAPAPVLRPGGSWRARADQIDRHVREQDEARRAETTWAQRTQARQGERLKTGFRRSAGR